MNKIEPGAHLVRSFLVRIGALLLGVGVLIYGYSFWSGRTAIEQATLDRARAHFRDIILTRSWNSAYGGVYAEKKGGVESNPYLRNPDIEATDGKIYTLRNPAMMTREISALAEKGGDYRFRITSLRLRNPANAPDDWERAALNEFERGVKEKFATLVQADRREFRYMAPLLVEENCLKCHFDQGYEVGDVRGGISVRFDITALVQSQQREMGLAALALLVAMGSVFFLLRSLVGRLNSNLEQQITRYDDLVQSVDGIVWEADANTFQMQFVSRQAERLTGFPVSEWLMPGFWANHVHPDDRGWAVSHCQTATERGLAHDFEYRFIAADGRVLWLRDLVSVISENGRPVLLRGLIFDISRQKRLEAEMRQAIREQDTIFQNALVGIVHLRHRRIVACNRRFEELFGYEPREMIGLTTRILYTDPAAFDLLGREAYAKLGRGESYTAELTMRRKNCDDFAGAIYGRAIDPSQPDEGSIWIYADISERKQAEQALAEQQKQLEHMVRQRTADLASALTAARVAEKTKDAFLANISHELRTPLNAVIGLSDLALRACESDRQRDMLQKIADSGQTLLGIINDLLDLTKIASGELKFEVIPFEIRSVVAKVDASLAHRAAAKRIFLKQQIDDSVPKWVVGDPLRVEQILNNLVSNAIKFTEQGSVTIRVFKDHGEGGVVPLCLEVEDTGIGMSTEAIGRIFRPFSQADVSTTRRHGGTGLGLSICKRLAEAMDGRISVESTPGKGSVFKVCIRLRAASSEEANVQLQPTFIAGESRFDDARVLVVDDQPINRDVVRELLAMVGATSTFAANGQEAVDIVKALPAGFDLILMDIQMPVMDGLEATRQIRQIDGCSKLPIVAMTAHTMSHEKASNLELGMDDHLAKPFRTNDFFAMLARWLPTKVQPGQGDGIGLVARVGSAATLDSVAIADLMTIPGLDPLSAVERFGGNHERYRYWLIAFANEVSQNLASIDESIVRGDFESARRDAHAMKGRVGLLGLPQIYELVSTLESAAATGEANRQMVQTLMRVGISLREQILSVLQPPDAPQSTGPCVAPVGAMPESIKAIIEMLVANDGGTAAQIERCLRASELSEWHPVLKTVLQKVRAFDFDGALHCLGTPEATAGCAR